MQFVKINNHLVNTAFIRHVEIHSPESATVHLDREAKGLAVKGEDAKALVAALSQAPKPPAAQKETVPAVAPK